MIKELEFESENGWYKGAIEVKENRVPIGSPKTYSVTGFVEDRVYGLPWVEVLEENLISIIDVATKSVMKQLRHLATIPSCTEDLLKKKGFDSF